MKLFAWLSRRKRREQELDEEIRTHLAMAMRERIDRGEEPDEARANARREFGNAALVKEVTREMWGWRWLETLLQDLRYGLRQLRRNPGFTAVAVITLALGIGANTAVFSVIDAVLLRPLPYPHSDRLLMVWKEAWAQKFHLGATPDDFLVWKKLNHVFDGIAAFAPDTLDLIASGGPERLHGLRVTPGYFETLGVTPFMGRSFIRQTGHASEEAAAVLSYSLWQRRFGANDSILGRTVNLSGKPYIVVGIMPRGFQSPLFKADVWLPLQVRPDPTGTDPEGLNLPVIARLKSGLTMPQAQANLNLLAKQLHDYFRETGPVTNPSLVPLYTEVVGDARAVLLPLIGIVTLVLLIGCATVANLLLARASTRQREMAVRSALGANRRRLARQLLTESVLLAMTGAGLGLLLAHSALKLLIAAGPQNIPRLGEIGIDMRALLFTVILSVFTGIIFGLAPALNSSKTDLNAGLKDTGTPGGTTSGPRRYLHIRSVLIGTETALALILLVGAGLLTNSLLRLLNVNAGFNPKNALTMEITLPRSKYQRSQQVIEFFSELTERVKALPGVEAAGVTGFLPLSRGATYQGFNLRGGKAWSPSSTQGWYPREFHPVTPGYCQAMGIPLLEGRYFTEEDNKSGTPPVVLISKAIASGFFPNQNPIGRRLFFSFSDKVLPFTIVGVVADTKRSGFGDNQLWLSKPPIGGTYMPIRKIPGDYFAGAWASTMNLVVRTKLEPLSMASAVRAEVWSMDDTVPVSNIRTMESVVRDSVSSRSIAAMQLLILAGIALILALGGIYGVVAYSVAQRAHDIGIRMALGARKHNVLRLVLFQNMAAVLAGIGIGTGLALFFDRVLAHQLYGISATDPATFIAASMFFLLTAGLACYIPARRATKVDPIVALRHE